MTIVHFIVVCHSGKRERRCLVPFGAFILFQLFIMDDKQKTIGLDELLDEVTRDLDELRKKNPNDYSVKNIMMWWSLEKATLVIRHSPASIVKKMHRKWTTKWVVIAFAAGFSVMLAMNAAIRSF